jgi:hypothetical protein
MKLLFDSLDALFAELRDHRVQIVRVSPAIEVDKTARVGGIPHLVSRVIVTAALDELVWAEWRYWAGRAVAEIGERGLHLPEPLRAKTDRALAEIARRVDEAGFSIRQGILTHDAGTMESFRL